jgi:hypothetical protein
LRCIEPQFSFPLVEFALTRILYVCPFSSETEYVPFIAGELATMQFVSAQLKVIETGPGAGRHLSHLLFIIIDPVTVTEPWLETGTEMGSWGKMNNATRIPTTRPIVDPVATAGPTFKL